MSFRSVFRQIKKGLMRFRPANRGNVAVMFGLTMVPIVGFIGAAVDYSRTNAARSAMQVALDSTSLMLARDIGAGNLTGDQIAPRAQSYFNALYTQTGVQSIAVSATYTANTTSGSTIKVDGSGTLATQFMKVVGFPQMGISSSSTATWGSTRMRVAMALDNTGSMADDGKMAAMQTAAKNLIDQLSGLAKTNGDIYVSIVPFAKDVNIGSANYNQNWIDWSDWDAANGTSVCNGNSNGWGGCSGTTTWTPASHNTWTGCVTDRDQNYDTLNTAPNITNASTLFPAEEYSSGNEKYCKTGNNPYLQPIMALSYDWTALKNRITAMQPTGNTNQSIGLAWAWQSLASTSPMNAPAKDPNYTYKDVIILLSDGLNTQNRWYSNAAQIDARQKILCDNVKKAGVTIYTIQVNTGHPADATSAVLSYCASEPTNFYMLTTASQVVDAFNAIGSSLTKLRISK